MKILIAEDQADILEIMTDALRKQGYDVVTAPDGHIALEKIRQEDPDIILLDLMMPRMHGFEVLAQIRENPPGDKFQPVIIVSALDDLENMRKGFRLEADHYIVKPWDMKDIIKGIKMMEQLIPHRKSRKDIGKEEGRS